MLDEGFYDDFHHEGRGVTQGDPAHIHRARGLSERFESLKLLELHYMAFIRFQAELNTSGRFSERYVRRCSLPSSSQKHDFIFIKIIRYFRTVPAACRIYAKTYLNCSGLAYICTVDMFSI